MIDYLSNLTNTSVGNFFKSATSNIGSFFSGTASKASGFLGVGEGPKYPKAKGIDETFGVSSYQDFKQSNPRLSTVGQQLYRPLPSARYTGGPEVGFNAFDRIKNSLTGGIGKKIVDRFTDPYLNVTGRMKETAKNFPTARNKTSASGLGASSITPGFGFAPRANRRDAFRNDQLAQAAIEAALANIKIQRAMLTAIKSTAPNITLASAGKLAIKRKVV